MGGYDGVLPFFTAQLSWDYPTPLAAGSLIPQANQQFPPFDLLLSIGGNGSNALPTNASHLGFWLLPSTNGGGAVETTAHEWDVPAGTYTKGELDLFIRTLSLVGSGASISLMATKNADTATLTFPDLSNSTNLRTVATQAFLEAGSFINAGSTHDRIGLRLLPNVNTDSGTMVAQMRIRLVQSPSIAPDSNIGPAIGRGSRRQWWVLNIEQAITITSPLTSPLTVTLTLYLNGVSSDVLFVFTDLTTVGVQPIVETFIDIGQVDRWTVLVGADQAGADLRFSICAMFFLD